MKKLFSAAAAAIVISLIMTFPAVAQTVGINVNGRYALQGELIDSTTYVPLSVASKILGADSVYWVSAEKKVDVSSRYLYMSVYMGQGYTAANGRCIYDSSYNFINYGTSYIPLRVLARAFDATVKWNSSSSSVNVTTGSGGITSGDLFYNNNDYYWLSQIISAESRGESFEGKLAVGNVVLNRVKSPDYPSDIYGVIFDTKYGVQFTPVSNGHIYDESTNESRLAAKACLEGTIISDKILYFVHESLAQSKWISQNCFYRFSIGNHDFYS